MKPTTTDIESRFTYHATKPWQPALYEQIRNEAKGLALTINELCPDSCEASIALTKLREVVMWANAAIAIHG